MSNAKLYNLAEKLYRTAMNRQFIDLANDLLQFLEIEGLTPSQSQQIAKSYLPPNAKPYRSKKMDDANRFPNKNKILFLTQSKRDGDCVVCLQKYSIGDPIFYVSQGCRGWHTICASADDKLAVGHFWTDWVRGPSNEEPKETENDYDRYAK